MRYDPWLTEISPADIEAAQQSKAAREALIAEQAAEITRLRARVTELEGALDFYACVDHYQTHNAVAPNVVQFDRGTKARAALEGKKDE